MVHRDTGRRQRLDQQQVKDAVSSFLTVDYVAGAVAKLEETAVVPLADPQATIAVVARRSSSTARRSRRESLNHFVRGGQVTAGGGLMQATTSFAQEIEDVDRANDLAATGVEAMMLAAAYASLRNGGPSLVSRPPYEVSDQGRVLSMDRVVFDMDRMGVHPVKITKNNSRLIQSLGP